MSPYALPLETGDDGLTQSDANQPLYVAPHPQATWHTTHYKSASYTKCLLPFGSTHFEYFTECKSVTRHCSARSVLKTYSNSKRNRIEFKALSSLIMIQTENIIFNSTSPSGSFSYSPQKL